MLTIRGQRKKRRDIYRERKRDGKNKRERESYGF